MGALLQLILDFFNWYWNGNPRTPKKWCAVFYFVAQEDAGMEYPETSLDTKLEQTIDALTNAYFDETTTYVVYRAIWACTKKSPIAKVVKSAVPIETTYFDDCSTDVETPITTTTDLPCFLEWAYTWCPAEHYAVFFWGHSFGPAGLFEPGGSVSIPPPNTGLRGLREAFQRFNLRRQPPSGTPEEILAARALGLGPSYQEELAIEIALQTLAATLPPKVDIVLFQDCWMSTLETAYELRDVVKNVIASQSLVPIGKGYPDFIWPYEQLLRRLATSDFERGMTDDLYEFHKTHFDQTSLVSIPIALLSLDGATAFTQPLKDLIGILNSMTLPERVVEITKGQIAEFHSSTGELAAGDVALIDLARLCKALQTNSGPIGTVATKLLATLDKLVIVHKEVFEAGGMSSGFGGISLLYKPEVAPANDVFITQALWRSLYESLLFFKETNWPGAEQP